MAIKTALQLQQGDVMHITDSLQWQNGDHTILHVKHLDSDMVQIIDVGHETMFVKPHTTWEVN